MRPVRGLTRQRGFWGYAVAGILSGLSSLFGASQSKASAKSQMRFQERMASTQYSRAMEDMRRAGLNPMLAYDQGGNAAPPGAGWSTPDGVSSALAAIRMRKEFEVMDAQAESLRASAKQASTQAGVNTETVNEVLQRIRNLKATNALTEAEIPRAQTRAQLEKTLPGKGLTTFERIMEALGAVFGRSSARHR